MFRPTMTLIFLIALLLFLLPLSVVTAQNKTGSPPIDLEMLKDVQDVPQEVQKGGKIPVMVVYDDMDSLGRRLVFNLRERFNKSGMFRLSGYKEKKIKLIIVSQEEFQDRPGLSSIYSLVWTYSYAEDVLSTYLDNQVGIIEAGQLQEVAETIAARTDEIFLQYSYLFEEE
ncbi:MAG: hypothetical protein K9K64_05295 [Desulfohalobiaceae bacterium]|nr:hypothetical protein [Desulfohalobiaceae bacterium]